MTLPFFSDKTRVRTLLQSEQQECGLTCLAMIANAYGHNVDLPYMRSIHEINRGGMSLAEIYNLALSFGLEARGLSVQNIDDMPGLKLPAILHWEGRHYVVLEQISNGKYIIHDPAVGRRVFTRQDFAKHFSGVALEFQLRANLDKIVSKNGSITLLEIVKSTTGYKQIFWRVLTVSIAIGVLTLATPILLQIALDFVLPQADVELLGVLAFGLCMLLLFESVGSWLRDMVILRSSIGMQLQFSRSVVSHGLRLPLRYFEARHAGDFVTRLGSVDAVKAFAADGLVRSLADAAVSIISVCLMFYYSVPMTFMVLGTLVLAIGARVLYMRRTREATTEALTAKADEVSTLLDGLDRMQVLKAHNVSGRFEQRWFEKLARYAGRDFISRRLQVDNRLFVAIIVIVGTVGTLYAGVGAVLKSEMTIGMLYAFFALRTSFFQMADTLTENLMHLTVISSHVRRLEDVIQNAPETPARAPVIRKGIRRTIEVKDVAISFGQDERPVVLDANLSIDVEKGEHIAIIGESGSGKSSLLKVIASIASPTKGNLLVDGQPLSRFGVMEYRNNIGAVFAEDGLFSATVAENVSLFDPEIPISRILDALHMVGLDREIESLPQGVATIVSNNNSLLSTGQRRRVLAARVLCRKPRLMLFDEITANLDPQTEIGLLETLCKVPGGKIFVTHSERVLDFVDRAYRMEDGNLKPIKIGQRAPAAQETDEAPAAAPAAASTPAPAVAAQAAPAPAAASPAVAAAAVAASVVAEPSVASPAVAAPAVAEPAAASPSTTVARVAAAPEPQADHRAIRASAQLIADPERAAPQPARKSFADTRPVQSSVAREPFAPGERTLPPTGDRSAAERSTLSARPNQPLLSLVQPRMSVQERLRRAKEKSEMKRTEDLLR